MFKALNPVSAAVLACMAMAAPIHSAQAAAEPLWDITTASGGTAHAFNLGGGKAFATYKLEGTDDVFEKQSWTFSTTATETGNYKYDWDYSGFHSWFQVYAELDAFGGAMGSNTVLYAPAVADCCTPPSGGFMQKGTVDFGIVEQGQTFGFTMHGSNFDGTRVLQGQLSVSAVPEPSSYGLMGLGLAAVGWLRRKSIAATR